MRIFQNEKILEISTGKTLTITKVREQEYPDQIIIAKYDKTGREATFYTNGEGRIWRRL